MIGIDAIGNAPRLGQVVEMSKSWRRNSTRPAPRSGGRYWQEQQKPTSGEDAAKRRRWKLAGLLLAFFGLLAALVGRLLFLPRDLVVLPITIHYASTVDLDSGGYQDAGSVRNAGASPIPVNGLTNEDTRKIESSLTTNFRVEDPLDANTDQFATVEEFLREFAARLGELRPKGPKIWQQSVLIYLSAHGLVDKDGDPCFLMAKSDPRNCRQWLKVATLIEKIQASQNLRGTNVVLLLDSGRIRDCWPLGVFDNDFADRLRVTVENSAADHLFVVNSAGVGQQAWTSPELNGTVFGYFVAKGLAGEANQSGPTVTLKELVDYLQTNVGEFTRRYRDSAQRPFLVTSQGDSAADVDLAYAISKSHVDVSAPDRLLLEQRHDALSALWDRFEQIHSDAAYRFQPLQFAQVANRLMRLEDLIIAGDGYREQYGSVLEETSNDLDDLAKARDSYTDVVTTVAALSRLNQYRDPKILREEFATWLKDSKLPEKKPSPPIHNRDASAWAVWDWLASRQQVTADDIAAAEHYLEQATEETPLLLAEIQYVRLVGAYLPWSYRDWGELLGRSFSILRKSEELAAPEDIRSFYWVRDRLDEIEQELRAARDQLFVGSDDAVRNASQTWNVAASVQGGGGRLEAIRSTEEVVSRAYRVRDASLALAPYFGHWAASYERQSLPVVTQLIESTQRLCEQLDRQASAVDETVMNDAQNSLQELQQQFEAQCQKCLDSGDRDVSQETLRDIGQLLSVPIPTPGASYHNQLRQILLTHRWIKTRDNNFDQQAVPASETPRTPLLPAIEHPAGKMLSVGDDCRSLVELGERVRTRLENVAGTAKGLALQTDQLFDAGPELANARSARQHLSEADQQFRWAAGFLPAYNRDENYVAQLWKYDHHFFLLWHGERALRDLWGPEPGSDSDASSFFSRAVARCVTEAKRLYFPASQHRQQLITAADDATKAIRDWQPLQYDDIKLFDDPSAEGGLVDHALEFGPLAAGRVALQSELQLGKSAPAIFIENSGRPFPWFNRNVTGDAKIPLGRRSPVDGQLRYAFDRVSLSSEPDLMAVTFLRGHLKKEPLDVDTGTEAVVFHRPEPNRTSILVAGDRGTKTQIVFVLDCSASMGPKKDEGRVDKMNPAKNALLQILGQIEADEKKFDVGFFAFGHRYRDERAPRDVEQLVGLGPAGTNVPAIRNELRAVKPFGYTPLYQSISDASDAVSKYAQRGKKLLIVITDGENFVPGGNNNLADRLARAAAGSVDANEIQLEIVGFGVGGDLLQGPTITAFANLSPRIMFQNATDIEIVKQRIIDAIGLKTYTVTGPGLPATTLNLGELWQTKATSLGEYTVNVRNGPSEAISLQGGEAIEMTYENNRLRHNPYRDEDPQKRADGQILRFHTNGYDGTEFGISLQKEDRRFTARPRRAFMTIQPVGQEDVVFYGHEMEFELRRPVPVLHYQLVGWPKDQPRARIDLSYLMSEPVGIRKVPLNLTSQTLEQPFSQSVTLKLSTTPSRNNSPVRILVDEIHDAQSKLFPLHLALEPLPLTVRHSLARRSPTGGREVTHVFTIEPDRLQNTEVSLQVTTPNERRATWVSVEPMTVDVHHWTTRK